MLHYVGCAQHSWIERFQQDAEEFIGGIIDFACGDVCEDREQNVRL